MRQQRVNMTVCVSNIYSYARIAIVLYVLVGFAVTFSRGIFWVKSSACILIVQLPVESQGGPKFMIILFSLLRAESWNFRFYHAWLIQSLSMPSYILLGDVYFAGCITRSLQVTSLFPILIFTGECIPSRGHTRKFIKCGIQHLGKVLTLCILQKLHFTMNFGYHCLTDPNKHGKYSYLLTVSEKMLFCGKELLSKNLFFPKQLLQYFGQRNGSYLVATVNSAIEVTICF